MLQEWIIYIYIFFSSLHTNILYHVGTASVIYWLINVDQHMKFNQRLENFNELSQIFLGKSDQHEFFHALM